MRSEASENSRFAALGRWIADHCRMVLLAFAALLAAASVYGSSAAKHLPAGGFEAPGSESDRAAQLAARNFGIGSADVLALYRNREASVRDAQFATQILDVLDSVSQDDGVIGTTSFYDTNQDSFVSRDGHETLVIVSLAGSKLDKLKTLERISPLLRKVEPPTEVSIGGGIAASVLAQEIARKDIRAAEAMALPIAALLTLLFFRSVMAALLPLLVGGFAMASCAAIVRLGAHFTEIAVFALNIAAFLGLGLAIDYSLLIVQRFREELAQRGSTRDAVAAALDTAGHAVWVSGLAVLVSLAVLIGCPVPVLRGVAIGGTCATLTALAGALLLLPAALAWLGPRVDLGAIGKSTRSSPDSPFWRGIGRLSMRHPITVAVLCSGVLLALASPALEMRSVLPDTRIFPPESEVRRVDEALANPARFDPGGASAMQMVVETDGPPLKPENLRLLRDYAAAVAAVPGVRSVRSPFEALDPDKLTPEQLAREASVEPTALKLSRGTYRDRSLLIATGEHPWRSKAAAEVLDQVRAVPHDGLQVLIGGPTAQSADANHTLRDYGFFAAVLIVGWNFGMLLFAFRSVVVPLKAVLMNVISLGASYGLLVWVFQEGHLANLLGFTPLEGIDPTIPLIMFAVVFGLSMDYEVFLLSRIREEWLRTHDNHQSVIEGLARTGRIITSAAVIMLVVIGSFAAGTLVYVKQMGVGIGAAILLDVTLVRALLVPATMQLLGDWNWWLPRWLRLPGGAAVQVAARPPRPAGDFTGS
jgi:RND superfamily putative drug exporter